MQKNEDIFHNLQYLNGFGSGFLSQAKPNAVPRDQNNPLKLKYGLYTQQLSGTAFTVKRAENQRTWLYKVRPSVTEGVYQKSQYPYKIIKSYLQDKNIASTPNATRWNPIPSVKQGESVDFVQSMVAIMGAGQPSLKQGMAIYWYSANRSMDKTAFYNADGDFLIVPHDGTLYVKTLTGRLTVKPRQILVIPRGIKFSVDVRGQNVRGWIAEVFGQHFSLPELGPIGSNGMANPEHFQYPTAWYEDKKEQWVIINKFIGQMFEARCQYSPYDVVGWKGNYSAYKYDLTKYNTMGSISFDHPDPCLFTVLTTKSAMGEGTACMDFVIFPPRWLVMQKTFRPAWYHRNCMSEFNGNICGDYDAKGRPFAPGCSSIHPCMTPHGPDGDSYDKAVRQEQQPYRLPDQNMSFMFESGYLLRITEFAMDGYSSIQKDYHDCWQKLKTLRHEAE